jgi:hypothetical protein
MLNALLLNRLVTSDAFINHPTVAMNGQPLIDPAKRLYYGAGRVAPLRGATPASNQSPAGG